MAARAIYRFDGQRWVEAAADTMPVHQPAGSYKALSWNVWFHGYHKTAEDEGYLRQVWLPRQRALLDEMRNADADFLCLQEVTAEAVSGRGQRPFLSLLLEEEWIRRSYYVSDVTGQGTFSTWYGVVIASRVPLSSFKLLSVPTKLGRAVLVANVNVPAGCPEKIAVATAHLESPVNPQEASRRIRLEQLKQTLEYLGSTGITTGLFMGDFNVEDERPMKECWERLSWRDLNDGSSSWFSNSWRPDRMLLFSSRYVCDGNAAQVVGRRKSGLKVKGSDGVVETPSDHFALLATLRLDASAQPLAPMVAAIAAAPLATAARSIREWSLQKTAEAVHPDLPLLVISLPGIDCQNVTAVVDALNKQPSLWSGNEGYVYSTFKQSWYKIWRDAGRWSLRQSSALPEVELDLVFDRSKAPTEAVAMLNGECNAFWPHDTCYVYSEYYGKWFKLSSSPSMSA